MKKGFSLTEWIVFVAVIVIVIAIAISSYKSYESKKMLAQVDALLKQQFDALADRHTNGQTEAMIINNPLPAIISIVSTPTSTGGTIIVHFAQTADLNRAFERTPIIATYIAIKSEGVLTWSCGPLASTGAIDHQDRVVINSKFLTKPQCS